MMQDPKSGEWLPLPTVFPIPDRALEGRLCETPRYVVPDPSEYVEEVTVRRKR